MGVFCEACGYRTSEIKAASGISPQGLRLTLRVEEPADLRRDVLKSETCRMLIPDLELEGGQGVMAGKFTTVEGLVESMIEELKEGPASCFMGDSAVPEEKHKMAIFLEKLCAAARGETPFTLVLDDPAGNSYIQSLDDNEADPRLEKKWYDRDFEQNEALGINDMITENYGPDGDETLPSS